MPCKKTAKRKGGGSAFSIYSLISNSFQLETNSRFLRFLLFRRQSFLLAVRTPRFFYNRAFCYPSEIIRIIVVIMGNDSETKVIFRVMKFPIKIFADIPFHRDLSDSGISIKEHFLGTVMPLDRKHPDRVVRLCFIMQMFFIPQSNQSFLAVFSLFLLSHIRFSDKEMQFWKRKEKSISISLRFCRRPKNLLK